MIHVWSRFLFGMAQPVLRTESLVSGSVLRRNSAIGLWLTLRQIVMDVVQPKNQAFEKENHFLNLRLLCSKCSFSRVKSPACAFFDLFLLEIWMDLMIAPPQKKYKRHQNGANGTTVREAFFFPQKQPWKQGSLNATNIAENKQWISSYSALFGLVM